MGVPRKPSTNRSACGQYTVVPGHQGITGNEVADSLADAGAKSDIVDPGPTAQPTISGIGSIARSLAHNVTSGWWRKKRANVVRGYRKWQLDYALKDLWNSNSLGQLCIDYLRCDPGMATSRLTINVSSMKTQRLTVHAVKLRPRSTLSSVRSRLGGSTRGR
ncbi:hypothetical protein DID88_010179 [Monilinia fructigena]|uniref:Uncharacterized protein n=1 Tax=Monilinia fructigena TaxID=38457 RepID=A0A395ILW4_9HELO|nr:hypothetical protein DID88_010179 [Monilinia fructigena]